MKCTLREFRKLLAEVMEAEVLSEIIWQIMEERELSSEVWDAMLDNYTKHIPKDHIVWRTSHPKWNIENVFDKKWHNRPVSPGDFVIAADLARHKRLWRVIEVLGEQSIRVESPQAKYTLGKGFFVTRWHKVGRYVLSDIAQKFIDRHKIDWRPNETLPEDYYSF